MATEKFTRKEILEMMDGAMRGMQRAVLDSELKDKCGLVMILSTLDKKVAEGIEWDNLGIVYGRSRALKMCFQIIGAKCKPPFLEAAAELIKGVEDEMVENTEGDDDE